MIHIFNIDLQVVTNRINANKVTRNKSRVAQFHAKFAMNITKPECAIQQHLTILHHLSHKYRQR